MNWPWSKGRKALRDAEEGLSRAKEALEDTRGRWPAVRRAAGNLDYHLARNGFADAIEVAMGGRKK